MQAVPRLLIARRGRGPSIRRTDRPNPRLRAVQILRAHAALLVRIESGAQQLKKHLVAFASWVDERPDVGGKEMAHPDLPSKQWQEKETPSGTSPSIREADFGERSDPSPAPQLLLPIDRPALLARSPTDTLRWRRSLGIADNHDPHASEPCRPLGSCHLRGGRLSGLTVRRYCGIKVSSPRGVITPAVEEADHERDDDTAEA